MKSMIDEAIIYVMCHAHNVLGYTAILSQLLFLCRVLLLVIQCAKS